MFEMILNLIPEEWPSGQGAGFPIPLDSESRGPVPKTTGWLQGRLSLSSFGGR